ECAGPVHAACQAVCVTQHGGVQPAAQFVAQGGERRIGALVGAPVLPVLGPRAGRAARPATATAAPATASAAAGRAGAVGAGGIRGVRHRAPRYRAGDAGAKARTVAPWPGAPHPVWMRGPWLSRSEDRRCLLGGLDLDGLGDTGQGRSDL